MEALGLVRRATFQHPIFTLERLGGNVDRELRRAGIMNWHNGAAEDWVPLRDAARALDAGAKITGDSNFGMIVAEDNLVRSGAFAERIRKSISLFDVCRTVTNMINLHTTIAKYWLAPGATCCWLCRAEPAVLAGFTWQMELYTVRQLIGFIRQASDRGWTPTEIRLCSPSVHKILDTELFSETRVTTGHPFTAIAVPNALLRKFANRKRQPVSANTKSRPISTIPETTFIESVRRIAGSLIPDENASIETVAEIFDTSKRTLQREIAKEGQTFRRIVSEVRYARACALLDRTDMTVLEISQELGYSGAAQFIRAFGFWAGVSPGVYRSN